MTILLALVAGASLGYVLERGDVCFHSTWRGLLQRPRQTELARAYLLLLLLAVPVVQVMVAFGWISPWIPPFNPAANIIGGLTFGVGMVVAETCVTGMFYKFGHGMLGTAVALVGWAIGDILTYRGPLTSLREWLLGPTVSIEGQTATVNAVAGTGLGGGVLAWAAVLAAAAIIGTYLYRGRELPGAKVRGSLWGWIRLGIALTAVTMFAWVLVTIHGGDYSFGTSGVAATFWDWIRGNGVGDGNLWIPIALVSITPGAYLAARVAGTLWVRGEDWPRYRALGIGGLIMGVGAGVAGGCNLGHSMVGVPLLSFGSIATTLSMIGGVVIGDRVTKARRQPVTQAV